MIPKHRRGRARELLGSVAVRVREVGAEVVEVETALGARAILSTRDGDPAPRVLLDRLSRVDELDAGDVLAVHPTGDVETLYRRRWHHNSLLVTERCNSACVMCSQPPVEREGPGRVPLLIDTVQLVDPAAVSLGLTGGEPALLGEGLVELLVAMRDHLPTTAAHVLSNGRLFEDLGLARTVGTVRHPDLMFGVPLYADHARLHDEVVKAPGAFEETLSGIENLGRCGVAIEIRVVLHRLTVPRLLELCAFVYRNLPYVQQVVLMGLEPMGYAVTNLGSLWVDPVDYADVLAAAVEYLDDRGVRVGVYNHPLCVVRPEVRPFATRSISEWKNDFLPVCDGCGARDGCSGFFSSAVRRGVTTRGVGPLAL